MKLSEYIEQLQELQNQYCDVDVKINKIYECIDLTSNSTYESVDAPFFDKNHNCVIVHTEFECFH